MDINVYDSISFLAEVVTAYLDKLFIIGGGGCYAHYSLNESSGVIVPDTSGNARNGTTVGAPSWVAGKLNNCLQLNGTTQYVDFGAIANFERTQACTFEFWIKTSTTPAVSAVVLGKVNNTSFRGHEVFITNLNTINFALINALSNYLHVRGSTIVTNNVWHYIVITYDGNSASSGVQIYIDNVLEAMTVLKDNLAGTILTSETFKIGKDDTVGAYYTGRIDEVVVYDRVISAGERSERWNGGAGTETVLSGLSDNIAIIEVVTNSLNLLRPGVSDSIYIFEVVGALDFPLNIGPVYDDVQIGEPTSLSPNPLNVDAFTGIAIDSTIASLSYSIAVSASENILIDEIHADLSVSISIDAHTHIDNVLDVVTPRLQIYVDVGDGINIQDVFTPSLASMVIVVYQYILVTDVGPVLSVTPLNISVQELTINIYDLFIPTANILFLGPAADNILIIDQFVTLQIDQLFLQNIIESIYIIEARVITPDPLYISLVDNIYITEDLVDQESLSVFLADGVVIEEVLSIENPLIYLAGTETIPIIEVIVRDLQSSINRADTIFIFESLGIVLPVLNLFVVDGILIEENLVDQEVMELFILDTIWVSEYIELPAVLIGINEFEDIQFDDVVVSGPLIETLSLLIDLTPVSRVQRVIDLVRNSTWLPK